jgi:1-acyl-sn-glycerol-3-phosphate acyltransferase
MFDFYPQWLAMGLSRLGAVRAKKEIALDALRQGFAVQVYPGGDYDACRSIFRRDEIIFAGRRGYVDLAREAGVPIVPVVSSGAHDALLILWDGVWLSERLGLDKRYRLKAFPLSVSVPWGLWFGPLPGYVPLPTKVRMRVLPPISPEGDPIEVDAKVRSVLQQASNELAKERRAPFCFT